MCAGVEKIPQATDAPLSAFTRGVTSAHQLQQLVNPRLALARHKSRPKLGLHDLVLLFAFGHLL
jgi:hypothetical protein